MEAGVFRTLAVVVMALALVGCADGEGDFVNGTSSHFTPGTTTRAQAVAQLGPPSSIYQLADGTRTVTWARTGGLFNPGETQGLLIMFGPDDKMIRVVSGDAPAGAPAK
jgi:hypothetical protein